jgi:hypothetical protein
MNNHLMLLTPLLVLLILAVFSFTGCAKFRAADEPAGETPAGKKPDPDPSKTPPPIDPVPSVVPTYGDVVATTAGFWRTGR